MLKNVLRPPKNMLLAAGVLLFEILPGIVAAENLPPGLSDLDPMVRLLAVQEAERTGNKLAIPKLATLAEEDTYDSVREAACKALETLKATDRIELLSEIAANDSSANVRAAAAEAVKGLGGLLLDDEDYKKPSVQTFKPKKETRHLAVGLGVMGGYGVIAVNLRGRFATGWSGLPWIGVELGGGWTPPALYIITAGPVESVNNDDLRMLIFSGAGALLLYPGRLHYAALRGGFDIGRGAYGVLAYGFEMLNDEGFFSWGVEAGILIQPAIKKWVENLCDEGDACTENLWPVIPCVRFSLQFYPL
jgi:hypothetical protein